MSKKIKLVSETILRDKSRKQFQDIHKQMNKSGGDIGEKVRKSEKTKEDKLPNSYYMDNPFGSNRKIETYEDFSKSMKKQYESKLEDFYKVVDGEKIDLNDDSWVKGTDDDFLRPMFKNLPEQKDRFPHDINRSGKFIETKDGKVIGQINNIKGKVIIIDIIDKDDKHQYIEYDMKKLIKKIVNKEIKLIDNSKEKNIKIDTPWGTKFKIKLSE
jgi:membrane-associated HD superfamily phosphohydrolase